MLKNRAMQVIVGAVLLLALLGSALSARAAQTHTATAQTALFVHPHLNCIPTLPGCI